MKPNFLTTVRLFFSFTILLAALGLASQPASAIGGSAIIVDRVWEDLDMDGILPHDLQNNPLEPVLPGVVVNLYTCTPDGQVLSKLDTEATNSSGNTSFTGLLGGYYAVQFELLPGYVFSPKDQGTNDDWDSDADPATGFTICFYLEPGTQTKIWDAGMYKPPSRPAALGNFVWHDLNKNGLQDPGEPGIQGVQVELYNCSTGGLVATIFTDLGGFYLFTNLTPGDYFVKFYPPAGFSFSPQDQGGDDALDSDADPVGGTAACITLVSGENDLTWDAGLYKPASNPGTGTPGYWKNHPEAWPVDSIVIGGRTYTKAEALYWLGKSEKGDKTLTLFRALVSAKLNVLIGNESACVDATIAAADAWLAVYPVGSGVRASSPAWKIGEPFYLILDGYNNGLLCAPHRD